MSKLVVIDQLHIDLLVDAKASRKVDAAVRAIRLKKFLDDMQTSIRAIIRKRSVLSGVVARVSR